MTMISQVNSVGKLAFLQLHFKNISHVTKFRSLKTTKTIVHAFAYFNLNHCNSLQYCNVPKYLMYLSNVPKYDTRKLQSLLDWSHVPVSTISNLYVISIMSTTSSLIVTGLLFLNKSNSKFYFSPTRHSTCNLLPTFKNS